MTGNTIFLAVMFLLPWLFGLGLWRLARRHPQPGGRRLRLLAGNLLAAGLLLSLLLLAGEIWCRYFLDAPDAFGLSRISQRWHARHYRLNNAGARDSIEYEAGRRPGARRLTILGDSFAAGYGVADVEKRFANRLRQSLGDRWEVHVIAGDGMDTGEELLQLREAAAQGYELDVVLLAYCLNDLADLVPDWQARLERIYAGRAQPSLLLRHSYFLDWLACRLTAAGNPDIRDYYRFVRQAYASPVWDIQQARLRNLAAFCAGHRATLVAVTFPFLHRLGPDYEYSAVHVRLDALWQNLGVPHLDLLGAYQGLPPTALTVSRQDAHPNEQAHALAATAILDFLNALPSGTMNKANLGE